jgi:LuxR family maltose regulon positive regulatory protein
MFSSDTLIDTKLRVPPLRPKMLNRPRLLAKLGSGKKHSVTIITGQAGSGKTSLMGQWIAVSRLRAVWYSLDETDNDSDLFFRYLFKALSRKNHDLALL